MLLDAAPHELATLREVLASLAPAELVALFDPLPLRPHTSVVLAPEAAHILRQHGLVTGEKHVTGKVRIRQLGARFYFLEAGPASEYRQDVWPETDALLAELDGAAPGTLLDMGTGSGIVAIEAAARGHRVVATDLYPSALALARANARLAGLEDRIDFRAGHLFEPVAGQTFDLVLSAPHYTRVADQLRLEALRALPPVIGARAVIATFFEWEGAEPLAAEPLLAAQAAQGFDIAVTPLLAPLKRGWFTAARTDEPIPGLVSRHRFLVRYRKGSGRLQIERPESPLQQTYAPFARHAPGLAVIRDVVDLDALAALVRELAGGIVTFSAAIPSGLLDACRWGGVRCVSERVVDGAVGAILDGNGGIRPCAHGSPVAGSDATLAGLIDRYKMLAAEATIRRGCDRCVAQTRCSRCLFPHVVSEGAYCDLIRAWFDELPALQRLQAILAELAERPLPIRVKVRRSVRLVAATGRALAGEPATPLVERAVRGLAERWTQARVALIVDGHGRFALSLRSRERLRAVSPLVAAVGELVGDGTTAAELLGYARLEGHSLDAVYSALGTLDLALPQERTPT